MFGKEGFLPEFALRQVFLEIYLFSAENKHNNNKTSSPKCSLESEKNGDSRSSNEVFREVGLLI